MNGETSFPLYLLFPLASAVVYVIGALLLKRAAENGADLWPTLRLCNYAAAMFFCPLWMFGGQLLSASFWLQPLAVALLFIAGQVLTLFALRIGDVSVATPVLGLKMVLVAFFTTILLRQHLGAHLWTAAALSSVAIAVLNANLATAHRHVTLTILMSGAAAASYALFDVLVQKWSGAWGMGRFLPITLGFAALLSMALRPRQREVSTAKPAQTSGWVLGGAFCLGLQAVMLVSTIATHKNATVANVLYSSRGLWSVIAVWAIGHWFGNRERHLGPRALTLRLLGAALLTAAILLVLLNPHQG
ncbi:MAG TPA: DMT family transporter [Candidatus Dormibacteraeota bacterium]|nr:DMT family transporter [Candidatus Dormibacteraeota bacterium]